jgi:hypothetical protein
VSCEEIVEFKEINTLYSEHLLNSARDHKKLGIAPLNLLSLMLNITDIKMVNSG